MWSEYSLEVVDAVARNGSFSAAAQELHRVPSAVSYTVRQLEEWLAVPLFERRHRDVELTPAGVWFLQEGRSVIKKMQITRQQCQQIANGWRGQLSIAVDDIVKPARMRQMIVDFYRHFDDVELIVFQEVFNGVWDALADGRVELAIGATRSIPVGGRYAFRDMGMLSWDCVVASDHPLAKIDGPLSDDVLRNWRRWYGKILRARYRNARRGCWIIRRGWWCRTGTLPRPASAQGCVLAWCQSILHSRELIAENGRRWHWKTHSLMRPAA